MRDIVMVIIFMCALISFNFRLITVDTFIICAMIFAHSFFENESTK